jgi:cytochrome c biogenesis protein CcmG, thiol:disulfide interchange protein DsbE
MKIKTVTLGLLGAAISLCAQPDSAIKFTLADLEGKQVSLSDYAGKVVVIDFWAPWCHACKEAFPKLNEIQKEFAPAGVVVIGINIENMKPEKIAAFVEKAKIGYKILLDPKAETAKIFGIKGLPTLAIITPEGKVQSIFRGIDKGTEKEVKNLLTMLTQKK